MNQRLSFTPDLYQFLLDEGYKYIYYRGLVGDLGKKDSIEQHPYILVASKDNLRNQLEDTETIVEDIESLAVREMLEYTPGIDFFVDVPSATAEKYNKK